VSAPPEAPPVADGLLFGEVAGDEAGHRAEVTVEADSPWFDGHFPDRPVLPAIAHVEIAYRLHRAAGERGYLAGIDAMRFSEPVAPGDRLVARLTACDEEGRGSFRLARGGGGADGGAEGEEVSSGTFWWGSPSADEVPDPLEPEAPPEPVAAALPHGGPARLVDRVAVLGDSQVIGEGGVPAAHAAVHEGKAPIVLAVELAAQTAAQVPRAREGEAAGGENGSEAGGEAGTAPGGEAGAAPAPRLGYLVRLRDVRFARTEIEVGAPLVAHVDLAGRTGPLARFDFIVTLASGEPLASGSLATWELASGEPG
jgi:3-hydroxyacyl-[acyl-carrier-protein] dehydratase